MKEEEKEIKEEEEEEEEEEEVNPTEVKMSQIVSLGIATQRGTFTTWDR